MIFSRIQAVCFDIFAYSIKLRPIAMADAKCLVVPSKSEEEQDRKATLDDCNYGLKWNGYFELIFPKNT